MTIDENSLILSPLNFRKLVDVDDIVKQRGKSRVSPGGRSSHNRPSPLVALGLTITYPPSLPLPKLQSFARLPTRVIACMPACLPACRSA